MWMLWRAEIKASSMAEKVSSPSSRSLSSLPQVGTAPLETSSRRSRPLGASDETRPRPLLRRRERRNTRQRCGTLRTSGPKNI